MHTLTTHFEQLIKKLKPAQERFDAARDLPATMRDYLRVAEFGTIDPHTRLVGSYAQDLSVTDIKDVDILVRVDGNPTANDPDAKTLIRDLRRAVQGFSEWDELPNWICPGGSADEIGIERARRSVHVYFSEHDFHLDLVPCIAPDGFGDPIWVPDYEWNRWIKSHPLGVVQLITKLNDDNGQKVRPLGKLFKHFRNHQMATRRPKSYWLLALLIHHVQVGDLDFTQPLAVVFHDLLDRIYNEYESLLSCDDGTTPTIPDPLLGHDISWNWERSHFVTFMNRLNDGRRWASYALGTNDRDTAIAWWQQVFGEEWFPSDIDDFATSLASAAYPGMASTLGSGLIIPGAPSSRTATLIRPTKFHGEVGE